MWYVLVRVQCLTTWLGADFFTVPYYESLDHLLFMGVNSLCLFSQYLQVSSSDILHDLVFPVFAKKNILIFWGTMFITSAYIFDFASLCCNCRNSFMFHLSFLLPLPYDSFSGVLLGSKACLSHLFPWEVWCNNNFHIYHVLFSFSFICLKNISFLQLTKC